MTWRYGLVKHVTTEGEPWFALHEIYDDNGKLSWTAEPCDFRGDHPAEVEVALFEALTDLYGRRSVVVEDDSEVEDGS